MDGDWLGRSSVPFAINDFQLFAEEWIDVCGIRLEDLQLEEVDSGDGSTDADQGLTSEAPSGRISNADTV